MDGYILKILTIIALSALKYIFGFFTSLTFGFSFVEILIFNVGGGMLGVVVYLYLWELIVKIYRRYVPVKRKKEGLKVNNTRRWIAKVVLKYELYGIAFLTPLILSVPFGTLLGIAISKNKWRVMRFMFFSFLGWTLVLYGIYALFGIRIDEWF